MTEDRLKNLHLRDTNLHLRDTNRVYFEQAAELRLSKMRQDEAAGFVGASGEGPEHESERQHRHEHQHQQQQDNSMMSHAEKMGLGVASAIADQLAAKAAAGQGRSIFPHATGLSSGAFSTASKQRKISHVETAPAEKQPVSAAAERQLDEAGDAFRSNIRLNMMIFALKMMNLGLNMQFWMRDGRCWCTLRSVLHFVEDSSVEYGDSCVEN